ncbi:MAG: hypothetical protein VYB77_04565 [Planctomycetota bacterium]|nr:hypothetical protein [Planctomycetota bacterium]
MRITYTNKMYLIAYSLEQASKVRLVDDAAEVASYHESALGHARIILKSGTWLTDWEESWLQGVCRHVPKTAAEARRQLRNEPLDN